MIHISIACDREGCRTKQGAAFDEVTETFGDLLTTLRGAGWKFDGGPDMQSVKAQCPRHGESFAEPGTDRMVQPDDLSGLKT